MSEINEISAKKITQYLKKAKSSMHHSSDMEEFYRRKRGAALVQKKKDLKESKLLSKIAASYKKKYKRDAADKDPTHMMKYGVLVPKPKNAKTLKKEEREITVGMTVKPKVGPHAGLPHKVIHVHPDGRVNIKPTGLKGPQCRYHLGAASCRKDQLMEEINEAKDKNGLTVKGPVTKKDGVKLDKNGMRVKEETTVSEYAKFISNQKATGNFGYTKK